MTAACKSNTITFGTSSFKTDIVVSKETAAVVVVCCDLVLSLFLWFGLLALKTYHKMVDKDVNVGTMIAPDFTIVME